MSEATKILEDLRSGFRLRGSFGSELSADEVVEGFVSIIEPIATEDFYCVMDGGALTTRYEGIGGLRTGWWDFLNAFETLTIEPEDVVREGADGTSVVEFVRLSGTPKGLETPIEANGAGVWRLRDGRLAAVEFHMDRDRAVRSVGLAP